MAHYPDLSTRCDADAGPHVRAIGWLSQAHAYPRGTVDPALLEALARHRGGPQLVMYMGAHRCDLCPQHGNTWIGGHLNLWIPTESCVYVAPELIVHYIRDHAYRPPDEFIDAALTAPPQDSPRFWELMERTSGHVMRQRELELRSHEYACIKRGHCAVCNAIGVLDDESRCCDCSGTDSTADDDITGDREPV